MARYTATIDTPLDIERTFDYISDFSTTAEWDPGIASAIRMDPGPVRVGTRFSLTTDRGLTLEYRTLVHRHPRMVAFLAAGERLRSLDTIFLAPTEGGGTRITYLATMRLMGAWRWLDRPLELLLRRIGTRAADGLRERLAALHRSMHAHPSALIFE